MSPPDAARHVVIAVSVFDNETGQAEYDRPVAGLSDLVVERLTQDRSRTHRRRRQCRGACGSRATSATSKQSPTNVNADYVLLGQLQRGESGLRFITHFIRLRDEAHLKANRLSVADDKLDGLEAAVVDEFERAVREHVLTRGSN